MWKNIAICSNPQYFKEKNYKAKILTSQYLKSTINKNNFEKKRKNRKVEKKIILKKNKKKGKVSKKKRKNHY